MLEVPDILTLLPFYEMVFPKIVLVKCWFIQIVLSPNTTSEVWIRRRHLTSINVFYKITPGFTPGNSKSSQNKWKPQINLFEIEYKYRCRIMDGKLFEPLTSRGSAVRSRQLPLNNQPLTELNVGGFFIFARFTPGFDENRVKMNGVLSNITH